MRNLFGGMVAVFLVLSHGICLAAGEEPLSPQFYDNVRTLLNSGKPSQQKEALDLLDKFVLDLSGMRTRLILEQAMEAKDSEVAAKAIFLVSAFNTPGTTLGVVKAAAARKGRVAVAAEAVLRTWRSQNLIIDSDLYSTETPVSEISDRALDQLLRILPTESQGRKDLLHSAAMDWKRPEYWKYLSKLEYSDDNLFELMARLEKETPRTIETTGILETFSRWAQTNGQVPKILDERLHSLLVMKRSEKEIQHYLDAIAYLFLKGMPKWEFDWNGLASAVHDERFASRVLRMGGLDPTRGLVTTSTLNGELYSEVLAKLLVPVHTHEAAAVLANWRTWNEASGFKGATTLWPNEAVFPDDFMVWAADAPVEVQRNVVDLLYTLPTRESSPQVKDQLARIARVFSASDDAAIAQAGERAAIGFQNYDTYLLAEVILAHIEKAERSRNHLSRPVESIEKEMPGLTRILIAHSREMDGHIKGAVNLAAQTYLADRAARDQNVSGADPDNAVVAQLLAERGDKRSLDYKLKKFLFSAGQNPKLVGEDGKYNLRFQNGLHKATEISNESGDCPRNIRTFLGRLALR